MTSPTSGGRNLVYEGVSGQREIHVGVRENDGSFKSLKISYSERCCRYSSYITASTHNSRASEYLLLLEFLPLLRTEPETFLLTVGTADHDFGLSTLAFPGIAALLLITSVALIEVLVIRKFIFRFLVLHFAIDWAFIGEVAVVDDIANYMCYDLDALIVPAR